MKYLIILVLLLALVPSRAQKPDLERMNRDIEVAENILSSLMQEDADMGEVPAFYYNGFNGNIEGSYIEGFGVLFSIGASRFPRLVEWDGGQIAIDGLRDMTIVMPEGKFKKETKAKVVIDTLSAEPFFRRIAEEFLADYAYLLRQLPTDEKVMIRYGNNRSTMTWGTVVGSAQRTTYSASVQKADLDAFQNERISRSQFLERIKFVAEKSKSGEKDRDLELVSSIFSRLYQDDLSSVFRLRGSSSFETIEGLGAVFQFTLGPKFAAIANVYGIQLNNLERRRIHIQDENGAEIDYEAEREKMEASYPGFLEELKRNIVEYGSIVKTLGENETLIFRVDFMDVEFIEFIPRNLEITARQSTLEAYRKGRLTLEAAVDQLTVVADKKK